MRKKHKRYALISLDFSCEHQYFLFFVNLYLKKLSLDNNDLCFFFVVANFVLFWIELDP